MEVRRRNKSVGQIQNKYVFFAAQRLELPRPTA
jgi:hypothetical protein